MATSSTADSSTANSRTTDSQIDSSETGDSPTTDTSAPDSSTSNRSNAGSEPKPNGDASSSLADRLRTAAKVIWASFLALVVVFTLVPVVALWFGAVPFDPPPTLPYFALVGVALVGAAALIAGAIYDV